MRPVHKALLLAVLLSVMFALIGAGSCSKEQENHAEDVPTLMFWHFWSEPIHRNVMKAMIEKFEQENHCRVQVTELSWGDGKTKLLAAFNANTAPDVLELGSDWVAQFSHGGVLRNLSRDGFTLARFAPFAAPASMYNGSIYALPWTVDTRVLYYNKDLLRKAGLGETPPATFDAMFTACEKIRALGIDGVYGFGVNGSDEHRLYKKILSFFWSAGGDVFDAQGRPVLNTPRNVAALEAYISLARCGFVETQRQLDNMFLRGNLGFVVSGSWLLDKIEKENPTLNFSTSVVPAITTNTAHALNPDSLHVSFAGVQYVAMNAKSPHPELAKKFIRYLTDGKTTLNFCKTSNETGFPADKNYMNDPYFAAFPHRQTFAKQLATAKMTPVHPQWLDIEKIIEEAAVEALIGRRTAQDALDAAQLQVADLLAHKRPL
jgi:ABC-type glycerol-3-phosphate transport system substrate-binding protein